MRMVEVSRKDALLDEMMTIAVKEPLILRQPTGQLFVLSAIDDFDVEVESLRRNREFMAFLAELSQEPAAITLEELRQDLQH